MKVLGCWLVLFAAVFAEDLDSPKKNIDKDENIYGEYGEPYWVNVPKPLTNLTYVTPSIPDEYSSSFYLAEHFDDPIDFKEKWITSSGLKSDIHYYTGQWKLESAERSPLEGDLGMVLKSAARYSAISRPLNRMFVFDSKPLVVQYEVTFQNGQECGGAYIKLLTADPKPSDLDLFNDETPFTIMFGPDKCGYDYKFHFIFVHKNPKNGSYSEKHLTRRFERYEGMFTDKEPHLITLIVTPDNHFQILVDHLVTNEGWLLMDFEPPVNPPAEIDDPNDKKPEDWDEREKIYDMSVSKPDDWDDDAPQYIDDPDHKKPEGWLDNEKEFVRDLNAKKPEDWDEEIDSEWEPPLIKNPACDDAPGCGRWVKRKMVNPAYKGKWAAPLIDNPNYRGKWAPRRIPNPDYFEDKNPFKMTNIFAVGFELWSISKNVLFDNIVVTDDPEAAKYWAAQTFDIKIRKLKKDAESLVSYFLNFTNEYPMLWAVYVLVLGVPIVLGIYFYCCTGSSQEKEEMSSGDAKKTDALQPDDEDILQEAGVEKEAEELEPEELLAEESEEEGEAEHIDSEELKKKNEAKTDSQQSTEDLEKEDQDAGSASGGDPPSSPRKRRPRKD